MPRPKKYTGELTSRRVSKPVDTMSVYMEKESEEDEAEWIRKTLDTYVNEKYLFPLWIRMQDLERGNHYSIDPNIVDKKTDKPADFITINEAGNSVDIMHKYIYRRNLEFMFEPESKMDIEDAFLQQILGNYWWRKNDMQKQYRWGLRDCINPSHGTWKVWYSGGAVGEADSSTESGEDNNYQNYIVEDTPYIRRQNPLFFLQDLYSQDFDLDSSRRCVEILTLDPRDALTMKAWQDSPAMKIIKSGRAPGQVSDVLNRGWNQKRGVVTTSGDDIDSRWVFFRLWDKKYRVWKTFPANIPAVCERVEWPTYLKRLPFVQRVYIEQPNEIFGRGICNWLEDPQYELNRSRTHMYEHRRTNTGGRYLADEQSLMPGELKRFAAGAKIMKKRKDGSPTPITIVPTDKLPDHEYQVNGIIKQELQDMSRVSQIMRQGALPERTAATQVNALQNASGQIVAANLEIGDSAAVEIMELIMDHVRYNWSGEMVRAITGPAGEYWKQLQPNAPSYGGYSFVTITPKNTQPRCTVKIYPYSAIPLDPIAKVNSLMQEWQMVISNPQALQVYSSIGIDLKELYRALKEAQGSQDYIKWFPYGAIEKQPPVPKTEIEVAIDQAMAMAAGGGQPGMQPGMPPPGMGQPGAPPPGLPPGGPPQVANQQGAPYATGVNPMSQIAGMNNLPQG